MHLPIEKKKEIVNKLFEYISDGWEVYLPLEGTNEYILLRIICAKCQHNWYVDEKECFFCKTRYLRVIRCHHCNSIIPEENVKLCPSCQNKDTGGKACLNCGKKEEGQFVPITFCIKCGNRKNKTEYKIISL